MSHDMRSGKYERATRETSVKVELNLDGRGESEIETGIGFLDHLIGSISKHARIDIRLSAQGDLHVDDHHTVEDCGIVLGTAIDRALGNRAGIRRFGHAYAPLDEALSRAVVDLSGRAGAFVEMGLRRESVGALSCENIPHFFATWATAMRATLHLDVLRGDNDHHRAESAAKAFALALTSAIGRGDSTEIPSTKGTLA